MDAHDALNGPAQINRTSRLALASALCACLCPPAGGIPAVILGAFALWQMSAAPSLTGRGMAWLGLLMGGAQIALVSGVGYETGSYVNEAHPVAARFVAGLTRGDEGHIDATASAGLKPIVSGPNLALYARAFADRLGEFQQMRWRREPVWKILPRARFDPNSRQAKFSAAYDLDFTTGAPAQAQLTFVTENGELKVLGFKFTSPNLRNLELPMEAQGEARRDVQSYDSPLRVGGPRLKKME